MKGQVDGSFTSSSLTGHTGAMWTEIVLQYACSVCVSGESTKGRCIAVAEVLLHHRKASEVARKLLSHDSQSRDC